MIELTPTQARLLHLAAQGLLHEPRRKATPAAVEQAVARMQMLQIDTIHVVARSPYLVLFSRLGPYPQTWLDDLLAAGRLAECWAHEASFVPAMDYPLHRDARPLRDNHWAMRRARRVLADHPRAMQDVLAAIRERGPLLSVDFKRPRQTANGWWDWKVEKRCLEAWFALGELMVLRRDKFQRVYDLSERVRARQPHNDRLLTPAQVRRSMLLRAVQALGVARIHWVADYFRIAAARRHELDVLCNAGELLQISVRGWSEPVYVHPDHLGLLMRAADGRLRASHTAVLSPFDPVIWDRRRVRELFAFDYRLECYTPAAQRRYGYFVLPVLHRGRLVARLDAKAHRGAAVFAVNAIYLQDGVKVAAPLVASLARAISDCARWHGMASVSVRSAQPVALLAPLRAALAEHA